MAKPCRDGLLRAVTFAAHRCDTKNHFKSNNMKNDATIKCDGPPPPCPSESAGPGLPLAWPGHTLPHDHPPVQHGHCPLYCGPQCKLHSRNQQQPMRPESGNRTGGAKSFWRSLARIEKAHVQLVAGYCVQCTSAVLNFDSRPILITSACETRVPQRQSGVCWHSVTGRQRGGCAQRGHSKKRTRGRGFIYKTLAHFF